MNAETRKAIGQYFALLSNGIPAVEFSRIELAKIAIADQVLLESDIETNRSTRQGGTFQRSVSKSYSAVAPLSFHVEVAKQYGVDAAILIHVFSAWIERHRHHQQNFAYERTWIYASLDDLELAFPFWSPRQIRLILDKLLNGGVLIKMRSDNTDRTLCYTFSTDKPFQQ